MTATPPQSSFDQEFVVAAAASFTIPATLIDSWLSGPIVHGIDSSYPWGLHLVLRLIAGTLLALLILRIWPNLRIRKAYFATIWMGVLLVGADLYFVMAVDRAWTVGLGTECPSWMKWYCATFWMVHFSLAALAIQHHAQRRRIRDRG